MTLVVAGFFGSEPGKVSPADEQRLDLGTLIYKNLHDGLAKRVPDGGPARSWC